MSPRVGNISFPVIKPTEPAKKFYSDKLAKLMDEVRCCSQSGLRVLQMIVVPMRSDFSKRLTIKIGNKRLLNNYKKL